MSYDIAVWAGPRPATSTEADTAFEQAIAVLEGRRQPPAPAVAGFIEALLSRWPDISTPGGDSSPWALSPLMSCATGSVAYINMTFDGARRALEAVAQVARTHGLVCYDPQAMALVG